MKILLVSRCLPAPPLSGDRVILYNLTRELAARGHTLELLAFHTESEEPGVDGAEALPHFEPIRERARTPGDYLRRLARPFPAAARQCWNPSMWRALQARLTARRPDIVHFFGGVQVYEFRNLVAPALPNIIVPYESYSRYLERERAGAATLTDRLRIQVLGTVARRTESRIFKGFDRVVLVTQQDEAYFRHLAPDLRTTVIPNGVDADHYRPAEGRSSARTLVFVGNMTFRPNVEASKILITDILPRVKAYLPEATAVIVGTLPPPALLALSAEDVQVTGWVPDIRPYLDQAACFVSPLMSGTGIRNKILEAMAMEVPVVATSLSCEGIDVRNGENIVLGRTPEELAAAVVGLLRDEGMCRTIAQGGRRLVRSRYTWGIVADQYEMLYDAVIGERSRRRVGSA